MSAIAGAPLSNSVQKPSSSAFNPFRLFVLLLLVVMDKNLLVPASLYLPASPCPGSGSSPLFPWTTQLLTALPPTTSISFQKVSVWLSCTNQPLPCFLAGRQSIRDNHWLCLSVQQLQWRNPFLVTTAEASCLSQLFLTFAKRRASFPSFPARSA